MGVLSLLLLCFSYSFFPQPPQLAALTLLRAIRGSRRPIPLGSRVEHFWKCFFGEQKIYSYTTPIPPSRRALFAEGTVESPPLKYNSPLFHITSNIDKYSQQPIQQSPRTQVQLRNRWEILIIIPYITVSSAFFSLCDVSNTTLLSSKKKGSIMRGERGKRAHHQFKAITLVFLTHIHTQVQ